MDLKCSVCGKTLDYQKDSFVCRIANGSVLWTTCNDCWSKNKAGK